MAYKSVTVAVSALKKLQRVYSAYNHVLGVTYLDAATCAPKGSYAERGETLGIMSKITYDLISDENNGELINFLDKNSAALDPQTNREVEVFRKEYNRIHRIPSQEYVEYSVLLNDAQIAWENAKKENDFASFAPYLEKIINYNRKFAVYYNSKMDPYDALLNEYEEGLTTAVLDGFFGELRNVIVPIILKIKTAAKIEDDFLYRFYPVDQQREFSDYLMDVLELDRNHCCIAETEHPFTTNFNNKDVRITTHYYENDVASSMYSVIHEAGHAMYELGCDDKYNFSILSGGVSMGIHESQSRFFENLIGRSYPFIKLIFPKMQEIFKEQLSDVSALQFYRAVNKSQPSLIRTDADELTYCLHVMIRYELEKQLIAGTLEVKNIPDAWNQLYLEYLGVEVPDDTHGCLQDSHWSGGMIGYFPSYAIGSAYGPQLMDAMQKELGDIMLLIEQGKIGVIKCWLKENIYQHASFIKPKVLFEQICGCFDVKYYCEYLKQKFSELYKI